MWIAFRFCIFTSWNSYYVFYLAFIAVVNCFQILYLYLLKQSNESARISNESCELLSDFVSLPPETVCQRRKPIAPPLWIAFRFCIFTSWNSNLFCFIDLKMVVNCFQILYLYLLKQFRPNPCISRSGCELLSDFVSLPPETVDGTTYSATGGLWIAFRFCIFTSWNSK